MEALHDRGEWWLPETPEVKVAGEIEIEHHGSPRLELARFLADGDPDRRYDVVLGTTLAGEPITLEGLRQVGRPSVYSRRLPEPIQREILTSDWAYVGAHLEDPGARTFREATIELSDLMTWAGPSGFDEQLGRNVRDITLSLVLPDQLVANLPLGKVTLGHGWQTTGDLRRSRGIAKSVAWWIEVPEPLAAPELLARFGNPLRYLLTFATDRPNEIERLTVKTMRYDDVHGTNVVVEYPRSSDRRKAVDSFGEGYLFDVPLIGERFESLITTWFALYDRIRPALNLLFGPRYRPGTFTDNHFLNVVAAAEGYHRATMRNEILSRSAHGAMLRSIYDGVPTEHLAWLKERLAHSNEPTLRERLVELHGRASEVVSGVLGGADDYAGPVVRARNALTHRGPADRAPDISGREMFRMAEQTVFLMTACLLLDLGFSDLEAVAATRRSRRFRVLTEVFGRS